MASTLPATPSYNPNVPVVTPAGGTKQAYEDPNSPEAILRKTAELHVQSIVDRKFDVAVSPYYESFLTQTSQADQTRRLQIMMILTILLFTVMVSIPDLTMAGRIFLLTLSVGFLCVTIYLYQLNGTDGLHDS